MKVNELLAFATQKLKDNNSDDNILKAKMLLAHTLGISKETLINISNNKIDVLDEKRYIEYIYELCNNRPIQYITNKQEFMKLAFYVDENVLIPQPDTEILVEEVLTILKPNMKVLDLCTGSGAIAIALYKYSNNIFVDASDISNKALAVAETNAKTLLGNGDINFILSDLFENIKGKYDVIVSNPPYIETSVIDTLGKEVKHEPMLALDGGISGLDFYKKIAKNAKQFLNLKGHLCLEIGYNQKESVIRILEENGYKNIKCIKDLSKNDRVIICEVI